MTQRLIEKLAMNMRSFVWEKTGKWISPTEMEDFLREQINSLRQTKGTRQNAQRPHQ